MGSGKEGVTCWTVRQWFHVRVAVQIL